jgi:GTP cyclohydrolase I
MQTILEPQSLAGTNLQELMREMLVRLGEDPERDGLRQTPERMERSMQYLTKLPGEPRGNSAGRDVRRGL